MNKLFLYTILLLSNSCSHHSTENDTVPVTNNPQYTGEIREWEPAESDPWWKGFFYNTLKNSIEEDEIEKEH